MGEKLLYSNFSHRGKGYYIEGFPGEKATMGEKLLYNTGLPINPVARDFWISQTKIDMCSGF